MFSLRIHFTCFARKKTLRNNLFSLRNIFSETFSVYRELLLETLFKHVNKYFNISRAFCARLCVHMCTMEINACMQWALCLSKREQVANLSSRRSSQTCGSTPWLHQCIHLRFRHTLGKVLQPFAAKLNVVWSLPVDRPVSIRASGNEPSHEAQDAHSIGQSATTAHCLLARQSVAPIAILPADSSPTCLTGSRDDWSYLEGSPWDGSGLFLPPDGWTWRRRCAAFPKACGHTRASIRPFCIFCERIRIRCPLCIWDFLRSWCGQRPLTCLPLALGPSFSFSDCCQTLR